MNLFEISQDFRDVFDQLALLMEEEDTPEKSEMLSAAWDTIDGIEGEMKRKIGNVLFYIRELHGDAATLTEQADRMIERAKTKEKAAENLENYIMTCLVRTDTKTIETNAGNVTVRDNPESVNILVADDEFVTWAKINRPDLLTVPKTPEPKPNRTAIKAALKEGQRIQNAVLTRTKSLKIN